jgi:hypothetical protein
MSAAHSKILQREKKVLLFYSKQIHYLHLLHNPCILTNESNRNLTKRFCTIASQLALILLVSKILSLHDDDVIELLDFLMLLPFATNANLAS